MAAPLDTWYIRHVSEAIVAALAEAKTMIDAGKYGHDLVDVVQHARELHDILAETVAEADSAARARLGPVCAAMGANVAHLEALMVGASPAPDAMH